jgi:DNA polymerase (family 10)
MNFFTKMPDVKRVLAHGTTKSSIIMSNGLQIDLRVLEAKSFGAALLYFTGSKEHNIAIREIALRNGLKISEYGVFKRKSNKLVAGSTEKDVYRTVGLQWIEPELRENSGEIEAAMKKKLPKLIGYDAIKGDFHMHTKHTDGANTVKEMIGAAKKLGYEYIAIADHSKSTRIAGGNTEKEVLDEIKEIRAVAKKTSDIKVFAGSEVDILPNGELDFSEDVLKKLDVVVASVHSRFKSPKEVMTKRIVTALENEHIDILGHPTGRLIYRRQPYEVDLKKVFKAAVDNNVVLEINSQPERMDLKDVHVREAKEIGARFAINTDAHTTTSLNLMQFGIAIARRGWLEKKDVINTYSLKQLKRVFRRIKL